ncbi:MAG: hypothetical protein K1X48_02510 [Burkholderiaceae bacterium]|nr:hypothetical protein [Burkholderiaceae bacterium]
MSNLSREIVVYKVSAPATTIRSARKSWFLGTLSQGDYFYHYYSDPTREGHWVWGYTPHHYGSLNGFGWISLDDLHHTKQAPPHFDDKVLRQIRTRQRLIGTHFTDLYTHHAHRPTEGSGDAEWKVTIKNGVSVPFYINQRNGHPVHGQFHRGKSYLRSADTPLNAHGKPTGKLKVRYLLKQNPNLMVANFDGDGYWGFILKQGDNFTVDFS